MLHLHDQCMVHDSNVQKRHNNRNSKYIIYRKSQFQTEVQCFFAAPAYQQGAILVKFLIWNRRQNLPTGSRLLIQDWEHNINNFIHQQLHAALRMNLEDREHHGLARIRGVPFPLCKGPCCSADRFPFRVLQILSQKSNQYSHLQSQASTP